MRSIHDGVPPKALSFWEPWADLVLPTADEVAPPKWIETRPGPPAGGHFEKLPGGRFYPGEGLAPGERLGIHASLKRVPDRHLPDELVRVLDESGRRHARPGGALLGEAVLMTAAPMVVGDPLPGRDCLVLEGEWLDHPDRVFRSDRATLYLARDPGDECKVDVTDQVPLGHFEPGRWGWLLHKAVRYDRPIPRRGRQGVFDPRRLL